MNNVLLRTYFDGKKIGFKVLKKGKIIGKRWHGKEGWAQSLP